MRNFRELDIWKEAVKLSTDIYRIANAFPKSEIYGLTSQIRRCSVSIASNIAEGCRGSNKELVHFLNITLGSSFELETQLVIAHNLGYLEDDIFNTTLERLNILQKRINAFRAHILSQE